MTDFADIFWIPIVICVALSWIMAFFGIHVLRREVIFIDIAIAQVAAFGVAAAGLMEILLPAAAGSQDSFRGLVEFMLKWGLPVVLTLTASFALSLARKKIRAFSIEAAIGVSYAISMAATLMVYGMTAHGHAHGGDFLAGSVLWATEGDLNRCLATFAAAGLFVALFRSGIEASTMEYEHEASSRRRTGRDSVGGTASSSGSFFESHIFSDFVFYGTLSIVIVFSTPVVGVAMVFAQLIMPASIAIVLGRTGVSALIVAGISGTVLNVAGLYGAGLFDFSVGPFVVAILGTALFAVASWRCLCRFSGRSFR